MVQWLRHSKLPLQGAPIKELRCRMSRGTAKKKKSIPIWRINSLDITLLIKDKHPSYKITDAIYLIRALGYKHVCLEYFSYPDDTELEFCQLHYKFLKYQDWVFNLVQCRQCQLEKAMAPHSSTLAWKIPWTEEPGGLQSMGSLRVGHD